jgi:hypothetical protein
MKGLYLFIEPQKLSLLAKVNSPNIQQFKLYLQKFLKRTLHQKAGY